MEDRIGIQKTYKIYIGGKFPRTESGRYFPFRSSQGSIVANVSWCSRKDLRDAVTSARGALTSWSLATAYLRGQILYRMAEMLEGRKTQFVEELSWQGATSSEAKKEVELSIDRLVYYAGWSDKYQQIYSTVNPVASSHINFSTLEPVGVVGVMLPESSSLLGLVSLMAPILVGGNTCVMLASFKKPLSAVTFGEVLETSDLPGGVVNILTGLPEELLRPLSEHMDVNALALGAPMGRDDAGSSFAEFCEQGAVENLKRVRSYDLPDWSKSPAEGPLFILDFQEIKTIWHPMGL